MDLFLEAVKNAALIVLTAYPLTRYGIIRRALIMMSSRRDQVFLVVVFGVLSVISNLAAVEVFNGALLGSRLVGPVAGGILAGPWVGFGAGVLGGGHRLILEGFTCIPDFLSTIVAGLIGGGVYIKYGSDRMSFMKAFMAGILSEVVDQLAVLVLAKPFLLASTLVEWIGAASVLANALGIAIFVSIIANVQYRHYSVGATYAKIATAVARKVLPVIKNPLNVHNAAELAEEIFHAAKFAAVSITDGHKILAFHGVGSDHHLVGDPVSPEITRLAEQGGEVSSRKSEIGCSQPNCPLDSVLAVPICCGNERVGVLEVYKTRDVINPPEVTLVTGIAHLLSQQLNDARLTEQSQQLIRAEYNVLRSQINPHFLFNSLSVIKLFIRTDPEKAQSLLLSLAAFFRKSLQTINDIVTLAEEMQCVEFYLDIQKARFGERLQVSVIIGDECLGTPFPAFALQPLVENALNHGLSEKKGPLLLFIEAHVVENVFVVAVTDNGLGISAAVIEAIQADTVLQNMGFGLTNVNRRLRSLYGDKCRFALVNKAPGTRAEISISLQSQPTGKEGV